MADAASTTSTSLSASPRKKLQLSLKLDRKVLQSQSRPAEAATAADSAEDHNEPRSVGITIELLPPEILGIIFLCLENIKDKSVVMRVCRRWYAIMQQPSLWSNCTAVVRNEVFTWKNGQVTAFVAYEGDVRAVHGLQYVKPQLLPILQQKRIRRVILAGPNIHRGRVHLRRLAVELPGLEALTFHACLPEADAWPVLVNDFPSVTTAVFTHARSLDVHQLTALKRLRSLKLTDAPIVDRMLLLLGRELVNLRRLELVGCRGLTPSGRAAFATRFPHIRFVWQENLYPIRPFRYLGPVPMPGTAPKKDQLATGPGAGAGAGKATASLASAAAGATAGARATAGAAAGARLNATPPAPTKAVVPPCRCEKDKQRTAWSAALSGQKLCVCQVAPQPPQPLGERSNALRPSAATSAGGTSTGSASVTPAPRPSWAEPDAYVQAVHGDNWQFYT